MTEWSLFRIEWGITGLCLAGTFLLAWRCTPAISRWAGRWDQFAGKKNWAIALSAVFPVLLRLTLLPVLPPPNPVIMEEFGYLLQADTFLHGRLTNPPSPLPDQLETFQQLMRPTYASFRPPGQGLFLAAGQLIFGHPWAGVCLTVAGFCAALCWMLQGWLPSGWALAGALLGGLWLGEFGFWMNSYWGGALSAMGGCLVLGAYPRIRERQAVSAAVLFCCGVGILSLTRIYEGIFVIAPVSLALLVWSFSDESVSARRKLLHVLLPIAAGVFLIGAFNAYYNWRLVGDPFLAPYQVGRTRYNMAPAFWFQKANLTLHYTHSVMRNFFLWELRTFRTTTSVLGYLGLAGYKLWEFWRIYIRPELTLPLLLTPFIMSQRRLRLPAAILGLTVLGLSIETWAPPYYYAPEAGLLILLLLEAMRSMSSWTLKGRRIGSWLCYAPLISCGLTGAVAVLLLVRQIPVSEQMDYLWIGLDHHQDARAKLAAELEVMPGKHLVLVKYSPDHVYHYEWVFNRGDLASAKVVWARQMNEAKDREIVEYYPDRDAWLLEPDVNPIRLRPFHAQSPDSEPSYNSSRSPSWRP